MIAFFMKIKILLISYKGVYSELGSLFVPINALPTLATLVGNAFYLRGEAEQR